MATECRELRKYKKLILSAITVVFVGKRKRKRENKTKRERERALAGAE